MTLAGVMEELSKLGFMVPTRELFAKEKLFLLFFQYMTNKLALIPP